MLNFINTIPENIGWLMVGFLMALCVVGLVVLGKVFVTMWRERKEDREN
jgi:hypothetical protein